MERLFNVPTATPFQLPSLLEKMAELLNCNTIKGEIRDAEYYLYEHTSFLGIKLSCLKDRIVVRTSFFSSESDYMLVNRVLFTLKLLNRIKLPGANKKRIGLALTDARIDDFIKEDVAVMRKRLRNEEVQLEGPFGKYIMSDEAIGILYIGSKNAATRMHLIERLLRRPYLQEFERLFSE